MKIKKERQKEIKHHQGFRSIFFYITTTKNVVFSLSFFPSMNLTANINEIENSCDFSEFHNKLFICAIEKRNRLLFTHTDITHISGRKIFIDVCRVQTSNPKLSRNNN
jgi:hypothetical protein